MLKRSKSSLPIGLLLLLFVQNLLAVMLPSHYQKLAENSRIKAIATVSSISVIKRTDQSTHKRATFILEKAFKPGVPEIFVGTFFSVDGTTQDPGVGGTLYYYPREGQQVYVTVTDDGGMINSLEDLGQVAAKRKSVTFTNRVYQYSIRGVPVGTYRVQGHYQPGASDPVMFSQQFNITHKGQSIDVDMNVACLDNVYLSPMSIVSKSVGPEVVGTFSADFVGETHSGGSFLYKNNKKTLVVPGRLVSDFLTFELVQRLPFNSTSVFEYNKLEDMKMTVKNNFSLRYIGEEEGVVLGYETLHHFKEVGEGRNNTHYWLNNNHQLIRVLWDSKKEFLLQ